MELQLSNTNHRKDLLNTYERRLVSAITRETLTGWLAFMAGLSKVAMIPF